MAQTASMVLHAHNREAWFSVLCICFAEYHQLCLAPPLYDIPAGNWLGPCCSELKTADSCAPADSDSKQKSAADVVELDVDPKPTRRTHFWQTERRQNTSSTAGTTTQSNATDISLSRASSELADRKEVADEISDRITRPSRSRRYVGDMHIVGGCYECGIAHSNDALGQLLLCDGPNCKFGTRLSIC